MSRVEVPMITAMVLFVLRRSHVAVDAPTVAAEMENYYRLADVIDVLHSLIDFNLVRVTEKHGTEWHTLTVSGNVIANLILQRPSGWEADVMRELIEAALGATRASADGVAQIVASLPESA